MAEKKIIDGRRVEGIREKPEKEKKDKKNHKRKKRGKIKRI